MVASFSPTPFALSSLTMGLLSASLVHTPLLKMVKPNVLFAPRTISFTLFLFKPNYHLPLGLRPFTPQHIYLISVHPVPFPFTLPISASMANTQPMTTFVFSVAYVTPTYMPPPTTNSPLSPLAAFSSVTHANKKDTAV
jgi:hypothetical protein